MGHHSTMQFHSRRGHATQHGTVAWHTTPHDTYTKHRDIASAEFLPPLMPRVPTAIPQAQPRALVSCSSPERHWCWLTL